MKNHILTYNQLNESNELENLSFEETDRLIDIGFIDNEYLIKICNYVKNGNRGALDIQSCTLTNLPSWLTKVNGKFDASFSKIEVLPESLSIVGSIIMVNSSLTKFTKPIVFGSLDLSGCKITELPDNLIVNGYLGLDGINFTKNPKNITVDGNLYIHRSSLTKLSDEELNNIFTRSDNLSIYFFRK